MRFVDTNVFIYAAGREPVRRQQALAMLTEPPPEQVPLFTSAEVLQELLHVYLRRDEMALYDTLVASFDRLLHNVVPVTGEDLRLARTLSGRFPPALGARDLVHLAVCQRAGATDLLSFDKALNVAWSQLRPRP